MGKREGWNWEAEKDGKKRSCGWDVLYKRRNAVFTVKLSLWLPVSKQWHGDILLIIKAWSLA